MDATDIRAAWNAQSDEYNGWDTLDADERVEFAIKLVGRPHVGGIDRVIGKRCAAVKEPMTLDELLEYIETDDYSAELALQHALLIIEHSTHSDRAMGRCLRSPAVTAALSS